MFLTLCVTLIDLGLRVENGLCCKRRVTSLTHWNAYALGNQTRCLAERDRLAGGTRRGWAWTH